MKIGKFGIAYVKRMRGTRNFYFLPKRITLKSNPAIYRWGYWNFCYDLERQNREIQEREQREREERRENIRRELEKMRFTKNVIS